MCSILLATPMHQQLRLFFLTFRKDQKDPPAVSQTPGEIKIEEYYAVYYEEEFYIGRAIGREDNLYKFKFLHRDRLCNTAEYDWPKRPDIESIHPRFIICGPLKLEGNGPFRISGLETVNRLYQEMRSQFLK